MNNHNAITDTTDGMYVTSLERCFDRQIEALLCFDDVNFYHTYVYDVNTKEVLYSGKYNQRALKIFYNH